MTVKIRTEHTKQRKWQIFYTKISVPVVEGGLNLGTICGCVLSLFSRVQFFATLWTTALSGSFVHGILQERNWSGLPYSPAGDLSHPGIKPGSHALQADFFYCLSHQGSYFATRQYLQNCSNNTKKAELMLEIIFFNQIIKIDDYDS